METFTVIFPVEAYLGGGRYSSTPIPPTGLIGEIKADGENG
jgi:hypothetical protein